MEFVPTLRPLVPKVSAALWERSSRRDSVSILASDDLDLDPHPHPPAAETEFRLTDPFPKRSANFGNESEKYRLTPVDNGREELLRANFSVSNRKSVTKSGDCQLPPLLFQPEACSEDCFICDIYTIK